MTLKPLKKGATYDDLRRVPDHFVAEMFDGELYASPRPAVPHTRAATRARRRARRSVRFRPQRPGRVADPRRAGAALRQRRARAGPRRLAPRATPALPDAAYLTLAPDWICEVLSPSTEAIDRGQKLRIYAREGVAHAWLVDPSRQTLEVLALESGNFEQLEEHKAKRSSARARSMPSSSSYGRSGSEASNLMRWL